MPIPFILGGVALAAGAFGAKKGYDGYKNKSEADKLNNDAQLIYNHAYERLSESKERARKLLMSLGETKIYIHENLFSEFVEIFENIKSVEMDDFSQDDLSFDIKEFIAFTKESVISFAEFAGGGIASLGAGALFGVGAYGSVGLLAKASTGTAISALSGVVARNATLAWLGGGSLAAGGFGMAGGIAVLGGIVAAPVLAVGGALFAKIYEKALEDAKSNVQQAEIAEEQMELAKIATDTIVSIVNESLIVIDALGEKLAQELEVLRIIVDSGRSYIEYSDDEKEFLRFVVNLVKTISGICEVNVLASDGNIGREFKMALKNAQDLSDEIFQR